MEALLQEPNIEWSFVYTLPRKVTIDTSTRIFQYKILSNILYLNNLLYKMTIAESPLCSLCGNDTNNFAPLRSSYYYTKSLEANAKLAQQHLRYP